MIRAAYRGRNGKQTILLGLGKENLRRLTEGQPIFVDGETVGVAGVDVAILFGEPRDVIRELRKAGIGLPDIAQIGIPPELSPRRTERRVLTEPRDGYPIGWPLCISCERPALDGKATCGDVACSTAGAAPVPIRAREGGLVRFQCARCQVDVWVPPENAHVLEGIHAEIHGEGDGC